MNEITIDLALTEEVRGIISADEIFTASISDVAIAPDVPPYTGNTEITPTDEAQVLLTAGKYLPTNITVSRISQTDYAHITYDHLRNIRVW